MLTLLVLLVLNGAIPDGRPCMALAGAHHA